MSISMVRQCKATTKSGKPCPNPAGEDNFCFTHSPAKAAARARAHSAGGRANKQAHGDVPMPPAVMNNLADAKRILKYALSETLAHANSLARVKILIAVVECGVALWKTAEIDERLAALEAVVNNERRAA